MTLEYYVERGAKMTVYDIDWKIMGQNLSFTRMLKRLTRAELAARLSMDEERLTRLEFGEEPFTVELLVNIALVSGITPASILVGTGAIDVGVVEARLTEVLSKILSDVKRDT